MIGRDLPESHPLHASVAFFNVKRDRDPMEMTIAYEDGFEVTTRRLSNGHHLVAVKMAGKIRIISLMRLRCTVVGSDPARFELGRTTGEKVQWELLENRDKGWFVLPEEWTERIRLYPSRWRLCDIKPEHLDEGWEAGKGQDETDQQREEEKKEALKHLDDPTTRKLIEKEVEQMEETAGEDEKSGFEYGGRFSNDPDKNEDPDK